MTECLARVNGQPVWSHVIAAVRTDQTIDPKDVIALFNFFMQRLEQREIVLGIREVIASEVRVEPRFYASRSEAMQAELENIFLTVGLYQRFLQEPGNTICVLTSDLPHTSILVTAESNVEIVELTTGELLDETPDSISELIRCVSNGDDARRLIDP